MRSISNDFAENNFCVVSRTEDIRGEFYAKIYYPAVIRGSPFLIGIMLGYFMHNRKRSQTVENKVKYFKVVKNARFENFLPVSTLHIMVFVCFRNYNPVYCNHCVQNCRQQSFDEFHVFRLGSKFLGFGHRCDCFHLSFRWRRICEHILVKQILDADRKAWLFSVLGSSSRAV